MRSAARRNEVANFTLTIGIGAATGATPPEGDFADSLSGGPDFWVVSGVAANDELNIRKGASTKDASVGTVPNGAILRNKGCRLVDGQRWCAVEDRNDPALAGWVAGRFLARRAPRRRITPRRMRWSPAPTTMPRAAFPAHSTASPM